MYICGNVHTYNCSGGTVAQLSHLEDENGTKSCWHLVAPSSKQPAERIEVPALISKSRKAIYHFLMISFLKLLRNRKDLNNVTAAPFTKLK